MISATLLGFSGSATASSAAGTCVTVVFGGNQGAANANLLDPVNPVTPQVAIDLPAGDVTIPEAVSIDTYPTRVDVLQTSEIWVVEFIGADGSIVGTSAQTTDVPDNVEYGEWIGSLGTVTLTAPAVAVQAAHRPDTTDDSSPNSVHASEITVCTAPSVCPTNADGTPVDPDDPTCPDPDACPMNADGTPVDPTDPDCQSTPADCPTNADGTPVDPDDSDCSDVDACATNADGTPVDPTDPDCESTPDAPQPPDAPDACELNADGTPVDPTDPDCESTPDAPQPPDAPDACELNADGTPVDPTDPDCQSTPDCPTNADGTPVDATDPDCSDAPLPPEAPEGADDELPITGAETSVFLYSGLWLLAAGTTLVMFVSSRKSALR